MKKSLVVILILVLSILPLRIAKAEREEKVVDIYCDGEYITSLFNDKIQADNHLIYEQIRERKLNGTVEEKREEIIRLVESGKTKKQALVWCFGNVQEIVEQTVKRCYSPPNESEIFFYPDRDVMFDITTHKNGKRVKEDDLYTAIYDAITNNEKRAEVKSVEVKPLKTASDNARLLYERGRFSTGVAGSASDRRSNIALALHKLNGVVLKEGETLSFNQKVGARTEKNGFKTAKIIMGGRYVDGVGGGVCQASTTLYNACLLSDLTISQVRGHSLKPSYVAPSFDAMVNGGSSDLIIKNDTGEKVFIKAELNDGRASVIIYGARNPYEIKRKSVTTYEGEVPGFVTEEEITQNLDEIGKQVTSYPVADSRSEGYLLYYQNGKKVKEKLIRKDYYCKKYGIITKKVAKPPNLTIN